MKKALKLMSVVAMSLVVLAGCTPTETSSVGGGSSLGSDTGTSSSTTTTTGGGNEDVNYTIVLSGPTDDSTFLTEWGNKFKEEYNYPNLTIQVVAHGEDKVDSEVTDWRANASPDVYAFASDKVLPLKSAGALANVPSSIANDLADELTPEAIEAATQGDNMYGYPFTGDNGYFMYYNKSLLPEDKTGSIEDILSVCEQENLRITYNVGTAWYGIGTLFTFGARYQVNLNEAGDEVATIQANFNSDVGYKAGKALYQLATSEYIFADRDGAQVAPTRENGMLATITGAWNYNSFVEAVGEENLGACKLPTITIDGTTANLSSYLGYKLYGVNPLKSGDDSRRLAITHQLADYLTSEEVQIARYNHRAIAPTNIAAEEALPAIASDISVQARNAQSVYAVGQTAVPSTIWSAADTMYDSLVASDGSDDAIKAVIDTFNSAVIAA